MNVGQLFVLVKAWLDAQATVPENTELQGVVVAFGKRELAKQGNQAPARGRRIVFVPGDSAGKAGTFAGASTKARTPGLPGRVIETLHELVTIHVWGYDGTAPNDELAQYQAAKALETWLVRALRASNIGLYSLGDPEWVANNIERNFGAVLVIELALQSTIHASERVSNPVPPATPPDVSTFINSTPDCGEP